MQLQLPSALEALVRSKVESGRYRDESEVVGEALRLLERQSFEPPWIDGQDTEFSPDWEKLNAALDEGEADLAAGRSLTFETAEDLRAHLSAL